MAHASLYYHAKYIMGYSEMELVPHWELCSWIQKYLWEDQLILLPRGTFKSSILSISLPTWLHAKNQNIRVLLDSYELSNTKGWFGVCRRTYESNRLYQIVYGDFSNRSGGVWHSTALALKGRTQFRAENSLTATSMQTSETSQHHDWYVGDDLQTEENVNTREAIDAVDAHIEQTLPILDPWDGPLLGRTGRRFPIYHGPRILVGTHWGFDDSYYRKRMEDQKRRRDGKPQRWHKFIRKAFEVRKGKTIMFFPKRFPLEHLEELKDSMSRYLWSCNYLNDPMPSEAQTFKLADFGFWCGDRKVVGGAITEANSYRNRFTILDPAILDTDQSDWSAFVTTGMDSEWNMFIEEVVRDKIVGNEPILRLLFEIRERWNSIKTGIEGVAFQKSLIFGFKAMCRERGEYFKVTELTPSTKVSKPARIRGFEPFVSGHRVFLKVKDGTDLTLPPEELYYALVEGQDVLADEMLRFPIGPTRDCIDALAHLPALAFPHVASKPKKVHAENTFGAFQELLKHRKQRVTRLTPT